jgi:hypothetical protein
LTEGDGSTSVTHLVAAVVDDLAEDFELLAHVFAGFVSSLSRLGAGQRPKLIKKWLSDHSSRPMVSLRVALETSLMRLLTRPPLHAVQWPVVVNEAAKVVPSWNVADS